MIPQLMVTAFGIWLTAAPNVLGYAGRAAMNDYIVGPVIASCAFIAVWDVMRGLRWLNVLLGGWLLLAPWVLSYEASSPRVNSLAVGVLVMGLSLMSGTRMQRFGGGWAVLLRRPAKPL